MTAVPTTELETRARDLYLRAGRPIDSATAARLRAARRAALETARAPQHRLRWMVPAGAFAVAALAVVMVWQPMHGPASLPRHQLSANGTASNDELPPDADSADPALYQNLDFYAWLAQQPTDQPSRGR